LFPSLPSVLVIHDRHKAGGYSIYTSAGKKAGSSKRSARYCAAECREKQTGRQLRSGSLEQKATKRTKVSLFLRYLLFLQGRHKAGSYCAAGFCEKQTGLAPETRGQSGPGGCPT
jgi:hypothetical protein